MAKRPYGESIDNKEAEAQPPKRRKAEAITQKQHSGPVAAEAITSSKQLQDLLSHRAEPALLRQGIQSLKVFLESLNASDISEDEKTKLQHILQEYLESQNAQHGDKEASVFMADLMQSWALASQSNNNSLLSAIPSVLARLMKTISRTYELRPHGVRLCETLLQPAQLKLVARNLSANNEYIISPSLRLLSEIVSFDGGSQAKSVNAHREFTLKGLGRSLNWTSAQKKTDQEKKGTVRTAALKYLLVSFKFQNSAAKSDLAGQRDIISALFKNIREDPPDLIVDILSVLKQYFILDEGVQRSAKSRLLSPWALGRLVALYNYAESATGDGVPTEKSVEAAAHEFLLFVCTTPGLGVLLPDSGWYPPGSGIFGTGVSMDPEGLQDVNSLEDIGLELDHLEESKKYLEKVPVRNPTLSTFVQGLRPYANTLQSQLLLAIFKAAPELVADYYLNKRSISFDPKLTATWIGYSAFLFSTVQLPVPEYCGRREGFANRPPPIPIVIESILPQPLDQKALTKCLNQKTKLVKFFAIRLLCVAFQKLEAVIDIFRLASSAQDTSVAWKRAFSRLLQEFCRRCPKMKDIITVFRGTAEEDILQREAVARLLVMYYKATPEIALNEKFDVSIALGNVLRRIEVGLDTAEDFGMRMLELEHLLYIAQCSPNIRWWNKPESLSLTAFTSVLRLLVKAPAAAPLVRIKALVRSIICRTHHLQQDTLASSLDALVNSLRPVGSWEPSDAVFEFLDNSVVRYARTSIKYYDDFVSILSKEHGNGRSEIEVQPVSLLLMTLVEQWPFLSTSGNISDRDKEDVARWLARYLAFSFVIQENSRVLRTLCGRLINTIGSDKCTQVFHTLSAILEGVISPDVTLEPQQNALLKDWGGLRECGLPGILEYLFDGASRSKLIEALDCNPGNTAATSQKSAIITTPRFRLLLALSRTVASTEEQSGLKRRFSQFFLYLTEKISIHRTQDQVPPSFSDLCINTGLAFSSKSILKALSDPAPLNALLETIFSNHINEPHFTLLAASIVSTNIVEDIDYRKLLQIILGHNSNPLLRHPTDSSAARLHIAYIIGRLFHTNPKSQSSPTTIERVLALTRGSSDAADSVLESVSAAFFQAGGKTPFDCATSYSFSSKEGTRLFNFWNKLRVHINPRRLTQTVTQHPLDKPQRSHTDELLQDFRLRDFLVDTEKVNNIYSDSYSHFFLYRIIREWLRHKDGLVDMHDIIVNDCAGLVVMGLCSTESSTRMVALKLLEVLVQKLLVSNYSEKQGVAFLLSALINTAKRVIDKNRLPTPIAIFAARALIVQADPLHYLYAKLNGYMLLGPTWDLGHVPLFYLTVVEGDCHHGEVSWMLENLVFGLRTVEDLDIYRRNACFGHICTMYCSPFIPDAIKAKILDVLLAATKIEGGSTTLITRVGMVSWIDIQLKRPAADEVNLRRLATGLFRSCNREHVDAWSQGEAATLL
ncbi:hypothetical protein FGG08_000187 [Glutinoglossum americanum]|uniref:Nucleolar pre-ribosomal-associated protein 1 n=1 Tax=Glutinoglossum americanum TaxID=1670608 RepID=A0A9P8L696_9PEZI|nr:hypothetical protein FGG08_000187 [Glutinoglossum americanum]